MFAQFVALFKSNPVEVGYSCIKPLFIFALLICTEFIHILTTLYRDNDQKNMPNKFANDGSFLQAFLKMQKEKSSTGEETFGLLTVKQFTG